MADADQEKRTFVTQELEGWQRILCGGAGGAMVGVAGAALAQDKDGLTSLGFFLVGSLALLMSMLGFLPTSIKFKDTEVDLRRHVRDVVDPIASDLDEQRLQQLRENLASNSGSSGGNRYRTEAANRISEHISFERNVLTSIQIAAQKRDWELSFEVDRGDGVRFDVQVADRMSQRTALIDIRLSLSPSQMKKLANKVAVGPDYADALVIVSDWSSLPDDDDSAWDAFDRSVGDHFVLFGVFNFRTTESFIAKVLQVEEGDALFDYRGAGRG